MVERSIPADSVFLNESNFPLTGAPSDRRFTDEARWFEDRGTRCGIVFHGSDVRDPERSIDLNPHSFFGDMDREERASQAARAARNRETAGQSGLPLFVSTPDLLDHLPGSRLLPLAIAVREWSSPLPAFRNPRPRVLHRPSGATSTLRGTRTILPVLERLDAAGKIELVAAGVVARSRMADLIRSVDILVDQVQIGAYGVTAVEALAAGRLVIGDLLPTVRQAAGDDIPIVNATPSDLEDVLADVVADLDTAAEIAARGPRFARRMHDGRASADALDVLLDKGALRTSGSSTTA